MRFHDPQTSADTCVLFPYCIPIILVYLYQWAVLVVKYKISPYHEVIETGQFPVYFHFKRKNEFYLFQIAVHCPTTSSEADRYGQTDRQRQRSNVSEKCVKNKTDLVM